MADMNSEHDPVGAEPTRPGGLAPPEGERAAGSEPIEPAAAGSAAPETREPGTQPPGDRAPLDSHNMLPPRQRRRSRIERLLVRLIATCGIVGIGVAIAAIMVSSKSQGWVVGLVVSIVSVVLAAVLWSSRQL
jgi:hypothetical protein